MTNMSVFHESAKEIRKLVLLKTFPVAVKLLEKEEDIPEGTKRPVRDLGHHLALCQGFSISRREGASLAMLKEDMWSLVPAILSGDYQVAVPCLGDQRRAMAQDDELIFTIPRKNLEDTVSGLKHFSKQGSGFPQFVSLTPEYTLFEDYVKVGRMMGMTWLR